MCKKEQKSRKDISCQKVKNICHNLASMSFKSSLVHYITYAYSMFMKSHSTVPLAPRNNQTTQSIEDRLIIFVILIFRENF
jgi:hypothetical protein